MKIEVRLFATLRQNRFHKATLDFPDDCTLADIVERLAIGSDEPAILLVNGRHATTDHPMKAGDVVAMFPPVAGG
jgi:molybdopterin converting factor small subunit